MLITSFKQAPEDVIHCFAGARGDVVQAFVYGRYHSPTIDDFRAGLDDWWGATPERDGYVLDDFLRRMGCATASTVVAPPTSGPAPQPYEPTAPFSFNSLLTNKYVWYGVGGWIALKWLKIIR